ncbi:hypothetical protein DFR30_2256 [Thiogranum longum]|uniref:Uncharacterized protein n=1 Tax=Thiogranum longum TaxID=1537524 RepID=A0A4R1HAJ4_9GAMM|nr:hypothetical protein [Thiogranum longum]TCK18967.1 hypothetical protein DFR30_2256 [Thiogranum longum]
MPTDRLNEALERFYKLQRELEVEIDRLLQEKREQFHYHLERGKVQFEQGMRALHKRKRISAWQYLTHARLRHVISAPIIYSVFFPFLALDIAVTIYQQICFRLYGIPLVRRSDHIVIDRHNLAYLNVIEKLNCVYCGYGNGVAEYVREVSARTEQYWCPIKHARRSREPHHLADHFLDYGDADAWREKLETLRKDWSTLDTTAPPDHPKE